MLQKPLWVKQQGNDGFSVPTYAYARNNPIRYVDVDGNNPAVAVPVAGAGVGLAAAALAASLWCKANQEACIKLIRDMLDWDNPVVPKPKDDVCKTTPTIGPGQNRCLLKCEEDLLECQSGCDTAQTDPVRRGICREMCTVLKSLCDYRCMPI
jgi:hypothetical protein